MIACIVSMGKLQFDSSIGEFRHLASSNILSDSHFARKMTFFYKMISFGLLFLWVVID